MKKDKIFKLDCCKGEDLEAGDLIESGGITWVVQSIPHGDRYGICIPLEYMDNRMYFTEQCIFLVDESLIDDRKDLDWMKDNYKRIMNNEVDGCDKR